MFQIIKNFFSSSEVSVTVGLLLILGSVYLAGNAFFCHRALNGNFTKIGAKHQSLLNASYELKPHRTFDKNGAIQDPLSELEDHNLVSILSDQEESYQIQNGDELNVFVLNKNCVAISIVNNRVEKYYKEHKGRFRKNGFFHLAKRRYSTIGIPFIFGGSYNYISRLGISKHGSLIVQTAESNIGAFLFILRKGHRQNRVYHFRRIAEDLKV